MFFAIGPPFLAQVPAGHCPEFLPEQFAAEQSATSFATGPPFLAQVPIGHRPKFGSISLRGPCAPAS